MVSYLIWFIPRISIVLLSYFNFIPMSLSLGYSADAACSYLYPGYILFSKLCFLLTLKTDNFLISTFIHCIVASLGGICVYRFSVLLKYPSLLRWLSVIGVGCMPYIFSATLFQPQFSVSFMVTTWCMVEMYHWFLEPLSKKRAIWATIASVIAYLFRPYFI